jgi:hypothetical protein
VKETADAIPFTLTAAISSNKRNDEVEDADIYNYNDERN